MHIFKTWIFAAEAEEQEMLARAVGTTRAYLYMLSADRSKSYFREPTPTLAAAIERETAKMHKASKGRLPLIYRTDFVTACADCPYAARCLGSAIVGRAEFDVVTPADIAAMDSNGAGDSEGGDAD